MMFEPLFQKEIDNFVETTLSHFPEAKTYLASHGKRLRPQLYLDFVDHYRSANETDGQIAIGLELLHLFFLIHDDIMDNDDVRRDIPTIHAVYKEKLNAIQGNGIALVIGDLVFSRAMRLLMPHPTSEKSAYTLFDVIDRTAKGQLDEYILKIENKPNLSSVLAYYEEKTALYSFYLPLALAACRSEQTQILDDLRQLSKHLGIAFQIRDDVLEYTLEKKRNADNLSSDLVRGKVTPLLLWIWDATDEQTRFACLADWAKTGLTAKTHEQLKVVGERIQVVERAQALIREHVAQAQEIVASLGLGSLPSMRAVIELFI